jgi:hypothetical protein
MQCRHSTDLTMQYNESDEWRWAVLRALYARETLVFAANLHAPTTISTCTTPSRAFLSKGGEIRGAGTQIRTSLRSRGRHGGRSPVTLGPNIANPTGKMNGNRLAIYRWRSILASCARSIDRLTTPQLCPLSGASGTSSDQSAYSAFFPLVYPSPALRRPFHSRQYGRPEPTGA